MLDGTIRAQVLACCARLGVPVEEVRAQPETLEGAAMFITNSLIGVRAVERLDGRPLRGSDLVDTLAEAVA